ncbi:unnamed protein product, partial [Prorocentrum cordatum]
LGPSFQLGDARSSPSPMGGTASATGDVCCRVAPTPGRPGRPASLLSACSGGTHEEGQPGPPAPPSAVPLALRVQSPNGQAACEGIYTLVDGWQPQGMPLWKSDRVRWLFSSVDGSWNIGGAKSEASGFSCRSACIFSDTNHKGAMPDKMLGTWWRAAGGTFVQDADITVTTVAGSGSGAVEGVAGDCWNRLSSAGPTQQCACEAWDEFLLVEPPRKPLAVSGVLDTVSTPSNPPEACRADLWLRTPSQATSTSTRATVVSADVPSPAHEDPQRWPRRQVFFKEPVQDRGATRWPASWTEPASEEVPADDGLPTLDICFWPSTKDRSRALQVRFSAAPIGVEFDFSQAPVRVKCVTCRKTAGLGIRRGMVVAKVGGVDATDMPSRKLSKLI